MKRALKHMSFMIMIITMLFVLGSCTTSSKAVAEVSSVEQGEHSGEGGADDTIVISNFEFQPRSVTVPAGSSVKFVNMDSAPHTATSDSWDTGSLAKKQSRVIVLNNPGTYEYICKFHPTMRGQIVVE